ncbi:MAG: S8 family serine peptidase [Caldilineaceae bacterium]
MIQQKSRHLLITLLMLCSLLLGRPMPAQASPLAQTPPLLIKLQTGVFTPGQTSLPLDPDLSISGYAPGQAGYYIVQFRAPVKRVWQDQLKATGVQILDYIPDYAFKVRMTPEQANQVRQMATVNWVDIFQPAYKLSTKLTRPLNAAPRLYSVRLERGANVNQVVSAINAFGAQAQWLGGGMLLVAATQTQINPVAKVLDVAWVEDYKLFKKHNDAGAGVIVGTKAANTLGYDGSSQIVAVADTGLGDGTKAGAHRDLAPDRIKAIFDWAGQMSTSCVQSVLDDGARDPDSGHGTHTSLSVVGAGGPNGEGRGAAPAAQLVFQAVENYVVFTQLCADKYGVPGMYAFIGLPANLNDLFLQAYNEGARIHSNSWGAAEQGAYTSDSMQADEFIWNHPDMAITFSAGNEGTDANKDGVVDEGSLGSPASAKNVISVGASENVRPDQWPCDPALTYPSEAGQTCGDMNGKNDLWTWGSAWPKDFPAEPLKSGALAGNKEQMAAFSSRGPAQDGRIKPDVVAPGTWVLSGYSSLYQQDYGAEVNPQNNHYQEDGWGLPLNQYYKYDGGTSMSNPIVAGAAAVVRDYYHKAQKLEASAALIKATLINTAVDMLDENNDGGNDNKFPIPNMHEGWGRVNVTNAVSGKLKFVDNTAGLNTNGSIAYQYNVTTAGQPFKATLVWSDAPGAEAAGQALVNNLDLVVTSPSGVKYYGNVFANGWSQTGGNPDSINNVENVYVQNAETGQWQVEVLGYNIPQGPQPFALVVDAASTSTPTPTITTIAPSSGAQGATLDVTITAADTHFVAGKTTADFGDGIAILNVTVNSATQAVVQIAIDADAQRSPRTVSLTTGNETVSKADGFVVTGGSQSGSIIYVDPVTVTMPVSTVQQINIMVSPGATPVNGVQVHGQVDPQYLRLLHVITDTTHLSETLDAAGFNPATGEFHYGAGVLGKTLVSPFKVLTLEVLALQPTAATGTKVKFLTTFPPTDISDGTGSIMEAAHDGAVIIEDGGGGGTTMLKASVDLQGRPAKPDLTWSIPLTVELQPSDGSAPLVYTVQTDNQGSFTIDEVPVGVYNIRVKGAHTLANLVKNVTLTQDCPPLFLGVLLEGDVDIKTTLNQTLVPDFGQLSGSFNRCEGDAGYLANADLNGNHCVAIDDFSLLANNYLKQGDIVYSSTLSIPLPLPLALHSAVLSFGNLTPGANGGPATLPLYVDPQGGDGVSGVTVHLRFNPAAFEVVKVDLVTDPLSSVLEAPRLDNQQGDLRFSLGALKKTITSRFQIATLQVQLKGSTTTATFTPATTFPYTDIAGANGSVMARSSGNGNGSQKVFLPLVTRK